MIIDRAVPTPVEYVREAVFECPTQEAFAELIGTTQATVSRWETKGRFPADRQPVIRDLASRMGKGWNDRWFFEVPEGWRPKRSAA